MSAFPVKVICCLLIRAIPTTPTTPTTPTDHLLRHLPFLPHLPFIPYYYSYRTTSITIHLSHLPLLPRPPHMYSRLSHGYIMPPSSLCVKVYIYLHIYISAFSAKLYHVFFSPSVIAYFCQRLQTPVGRRSTLVYLRPGTCQQCFALIADFISYSASLQAYMQRAALHKLQRKDDEARADFQKVRSGATPKHVYVRFADRYFGFAALCAHVSFKFCRFSAPEIDTSSVCITFKQRSQNIPWWQLMHRDAPGCSWSYRLPVPAH